MRALIVCVWMVIVSMVIVGAVFFIDGGDYTTTPQELVANVDDAKELHVKLSDGRTVTCIIYARTAASLQCDWANAR